MTMLSSSFYDYVLYDICEYVFYDIFMTTLSMLFL